MEGNDFVLGQFSIEPFTSSVRVDLLLGNWEEITNKSGEKGALSGTDFADNEDEFTFLDLEVNVLESNDVVEFALLLHFLFLLLLFLKVLFLFLWSSLLLSVTFHFVVHLVEHLVNVDGLESPTEALVLDFNGVFGFNWLLFDHLGVLNFFNLEVVLDSSHGNKNVRNLVSQMLEVMKWSLDFVHESHDFSGNWKVHVVSVTKVEREGA